MNRVADVRWQRRALTGGRYLASHFGKALIWLTLEVYALYYLTNVLRFPPAFVGGFFLALLVMDGGFNILVGLVIDRYASRRAINRLITVAAPLMAVAFALSFNAPSAVTAVPWTFGLMLVTRMLFSFVDVPHNALLLHLSALGEDADFLAFARQATNLIAALALATLSFGLIGRALTADSVGWLAAATGVVGGGLILLFPRLPADESQEPPRQGSPFPRLPKVVIVPVVFATLTITLIAAVLSTLFSHALPYAADAIGQNTRLTGTLLIWLSVVKLVAAPLSWRLIRNVGAVTAAQVIFAVTCLAGILIYFGAGRGPLVVPALIVTGIADCGMTIVCWSLAIRAHRRLHLAGDGHESVLMSVFTSMSRLGSGLSGLILGGLLSLRGVPLLSGVSAVLCIGGVTAIVILAASRPLFRPTGGDSRNS